MTSFEEPGPGVFIPREYMPDHGCQCGGAGWDGCPPDPAVLARLALEQEVAADLLSEAQQGPPTLERVVARQLAATARGGRSNAAAGLSGVNRPSALPPAPPQPAHPYERRFAGRKGKETRE